MSTTNRSADKGGSAPSRAAGLSTGPTADHTTGSGFYAYVEADGNSNKTAILEGPCVDLNGATIAEWTFFYHRQGSELSQGQPVLIDRFLEDAIEVDVDAISDGERTIVMGGQLDV